MAKAETAVSENPFERIEALLQNPAATGIFLTSLSPHSSLSASGLLPGDILTEISGTPLRDRKTFFEAMQPKGEKGEKRHLKGLRAQGDRFEIEVPAGRLGAGICLVEKGKSAWTSKADYAGEPELSMFRGKRELCWRNWLDGQVAGFERIRITPEGNQFRAEHLFRLGGGEKDQLWSYSTRAETIHRFDRYLSVTRTAFWEGEPGKETRRGDVSLENGIWKGVQRTPDGKETETASAAPTPSALTTYAITLLPYTLPLREATCLTIPLASDGAGIATGRARLECVGRRRVQADGRAYESWCFAWRHYGLRGDEEDEKF